MRDFEPKTVLEGSLIGFELDEIYPGVKGYACEHEGHIYIPLIMGKGEGKVGEFLDRLSLRCRMVNVTSAKLRGMLERRSWKMTIDNEHGVDVWEPPCPD